MGTDFESVPIHSGSNNNERRSHYTKNSSPASAATCSTAGTKSWRWMSRTTIRCPACPTAARMCRTKGTIGATYFKQLFRLQAELVKLQDWVAAHAAEGRDPVRRPRCGRQGRRDQAHHAAAQPARLPRGRAARAQRPRAHAVVLPALRAAPAGGRRDRAVRSQLVQPRRRRARDGLLHATRSTRSSSARCRSSNACWCARASRLLKYWFSITDEEQHLRFLGRIHDPLKQWKLSPMDLESRRRWEDYTKAKEIMLERTPHPRGALVGGAGGRQEAGAAQLHRPPAEAVSVRGDAQAVRRSCPSASGTRTTRARRCRPTCWCRRSTDGKWGHSCFSRPCFPHAA